MSMVMKHFILSDKGSNVSDENFIVYEIALSSTSGILVLLFGWLYFSLRKNESGIFAKRLAGCMCLVNVLILAKFGLTLLTIDCTNTNEPCTIKDNETAILVVWCFPAMVSLGLFNIGQLYFAFHYFNC